jgi:hypothetical protein
MGMDAFKPVARKLGGIGELTVCADLLRSGYSVFRAVADHEDCDIVAIRHGKVWRVEVKTCRSNADGRLMLPKVDRTRCDVLAGVDHYGRVTYDPPFNEAPSQTVREAAVG